MTTRTLRNIVGILGVWALVQGVPAAGQMTPAEALREAMDTETIKGDLRSALEQYEALSGSADRAVAARALVRMAGVHEKLAQPAPARIARERVVSEFGDQPAAVAEARQRIEAPASGAPVPRTVRVREHRGGVGRVTGDPPLMAYIGPSGNQAVMDLAAGTARILTEGGTLDGAMSIESIASPDGRRVAYSWFDIPAERGSLRIVDTTAASGSVPAPVVIYDNPDVWLPVATDWSADSRYLAVRLERLDDTAQIALVGVTDRSVQYLHTLGWNGKVEIRLSPDARYVAFDMPGAEETADQHIFVMAVDGSSRVAVTPNPGAYRVVGWTADGQRVLFTSQQEGRTSLWAVTVRGGRPGVAPQMLAPSLDGEPLGLTPSGALYYRMLANAADRAVASFDATTGRLTSAPSRPLQPAAAIHRGGGWSPDGRRLAYARSDRRGGDWTLFIRDMTTAISRPVPHSLSYMHPDVTRWTRDGRGVVVYGQQRRGPQGNFRIDVATGKVEASRLRSACDEGSTVDLGLPGEERGFFCVSGEALRYVDTATGRGRDLVRAPALDLIGGSPDGQQAAFITTDPATGATSVRVLTLATGEVKDTFSVAAPLTIFRPTSAWTPDGRSLVVQKLAQGQPFEMWFVPLDGRPAHRIDMPVQVGVGWHFSPSTDQVVFGLRAAGARSEIWKMEHVVPGS